MLAESYRIAYTFCFYINNCLDRDLVENMSTMQCFTCKDYQSQSQALENDSQLHRAEKEAKKDGFSLHTFYYY